MGKIQWSIISREEDFYSYLSMDDSTAADYTHAKRVCKDFEVKRLGEYHDLYVQSDELLADVFNIFHATELFW